MTGKLSRPVLPFFPLAHARRFSFLVLERIKKSRLPPRVSKEREKRGEGKGRKDGS